jgi:hypothetical protein
MRRGRCLHKCPTPCTYREDTGKKEQGQALLNEGSVPPVPDEDGPAIMVAMAPTVSEDGGSYKTLSK